MKVDPINQFCSDLNWLIQSPSLIASSDAHTRIIDNLNSWMESLGGKPGDLVIKPEDASTIQAQISSFKRLGHYAEYLFYCWASNQPSIQLLDKGVQLVGSDGHTAGELDFLLSIAGKPVHLEMAVKFYLMKDSEEALSSFVGPNARDRFDLKFQKMFFTQSQWMQQLALRKNIRFKTHISPEILAQDWHSAVLIKGMLFHHWQMEHAEVPLPNEVNPSCEWGEWCYKKEWNAYSTKDAKTEYWKPLPRLQWLSAVSNLDKSEAISTHELGRLIVESRRPLMVSALTVGRNGLLKQKSRVIIVPDEWPGNNYI